VHLGCIKCFGAAALPTHRSMLMTMARGSRKLPVFLRLTHGIHGIPC